MGVRTGARAGGRADNALTDKGWAMAMAKQLKNPTRKNGRPAKYGEVMTERINISLTRRQARTLEELGGADWVRQRLDIAAEREAERILGKVLAQAC